MPDLTLGEAKTIAAVVVVVLIVLALVAAWIMKEVMQKVAVVVILGLLALLVWTQRASLQECADNVAAIRSFDLAEEDTTCTLFGRDIEIDTSRSS